MPSGQTKKEGTPKKAAPAAQTAPVNGGDNKKTAKPRGGGAKDLPWYFQLPPFKIELETNSDGIHRGLKPVGQFVYSLDFEIVTPGFLRFMIFSFLLGTFISLTLTASYAYGWNRNHKFPTLPASDEGKLVDVFGGFKFYIKCSKTNSPYTVVLDAGFGQDSSEYAEVYQKLSSKSRVCVYDRQGFGYSELAPQPSAHLSTTGNRVASVMAKDLKFLLQEAKVPGPYVLVGHGPSAIAAQYFAEKYGNVAGLVLLNPLSKAAVENNNFEWKTYLDKQWRSNYFWKWNLAVLGVQGFLVDQNMSELPSWFAKLSPERQAITRHVLGRSEYWRAMLEEAALVPLSLAELAELRSGSPKSVASLPVEVLHSTEFGSGSTASMDAQLAHSAQAISKLYAKAQISKVQGDDSFPRTNAGLIVEHISKVLPVKN